MSKRWGLWCLLLIINTIHAQPVEHAVWDKTPIRIMLPLNEERMIRFPLAVSIVDSELEELVGVMKAQDVLYLKARKTFTNKRLIVQLMPYGEAIILTISASVDATNTTPIKVVMADNEPSNDESFNKDLPSDEALPNEATLNNQINPVSLTRFAIQSLYSPERLLVTPPGVARTPMRTHRNITLVYGASMTATPLISWRGSDIYVTAVELKNQLNKQVTVNPQMLLGDWETAAFYPTNTVEARGKNDTTTVFVTSTKPFGEALADNREFVR